LTVGTKGGEGQKEFCFYFFAFMTFLAFLALSPFFLSLFVLFITTSFWVSCGEHCRCQFHQRKCTNFSYERSFFYVHVSREKLPKWGFVRKIRTFNVDEIDGRSAWSEPLTLEGVLKSTSFYATLRTASYWVAHTDI